MAQLKEASGDDVERVLQDELEAMLPRDRDAVQRRFIWIRPNLANLHLFFVCVCVLVQIQPAAAEPGVQYGAPQRHACHSC